MTLVQFLRRNLFTVTMNKLSEIPNVKIDSEGVFKYILIRVSDQDTQKLIVRGFARCDYHADILSLTETTEGIGFTLKCLGGGRIKHEPSKKSLLVYGYSQGFGRADHQKTVEILKEHYPNYSVTFSNNGY